ncbi:hypothetical protein L208DRAFT_1551542 [Tricholoma matsutake]|nr:hypothetical protein L208DRAFT_1551542 [Tricholoma matsutake 945]
MRAELLNGYSLPSKPPATHHKGWDLSVSEQTSLKHYIAWSKSRGTIRAYKLHATVLHDASGIEILSLYNVRKLASSLTGLEPTYVDICSKSCIAYVGDYANLTTCPYSRDGKTVCGTPHYKPSPPGSTTKKPKARMLTFSILTWIEALFANVESSMQLRQRDATLQQVIQLASTKPFLILVIQ